MATKIYVCLIMLFSVISLSYGETYAVKISTEQPVNLVDSRFLSFTVDPKYLFSSGEQYSSKECLCMASSLSPAYLRIAGPSTSHMSFHNTTISINDLGFELRNEEFEVMAIDADAPRKVPLELMSKKLTIPHRVWRKFIYWAKSTGFDLVFALNNEERTPSGMWDPNTAINMMTVAEKVKIGDIYWELGYECTNQSIEEYLNDLETLRVIVETFPPGRTGEWKVVGGDISKCLDADSKSDFKDYVTMSDDIMDALLLNGNSSAHELEQMSEMDRMRLLRLLYHSETPLWLTEDSQKKYNHLERAADWLASLGVSAKNGFSVNYRELEEEELYEPTLSFYMALLFKNLVGERVLNVDMNPDQAILFAHCTSLRHKPVSGAVTLFGVNMDEEPARFALKLSKQEEGGDILQFILTHDYSGNIVVNGRAMYYEGDIKPVVKRVRPYKTLLVNLPPKSFGFWVVAHTNIKACQYSHENNKTSFGTENPSKNARGKRSTDYDFEDYSPTVDLSYDFEDSGMINSLNNALNNRIRDMNKDLNKIHNAFLNNIDRFKRDDSQNVGLNILKRKLRHRIGNNNTELDFNPKVLLGGIIQKAKQSVDVIKNKGLEEVKRRLNRNKLSKRQSRNPSAKTTLPVKYYETKTYNKKQSIMNKKLKNKNKLSQNKYEINSKTDPSRRNLQKSPKGSEVFKNSNEHISKSSVLKTDIGNKLNTEDNNADVEDIVNKVQKRKRRQTETEETSRENDIETDKTSKAELFSMLKQIHKDLERFPEEYEGKIDSEYLDSHEGLILKTQLADDAATIHVKGSSKGLLTSAMKNVVNVLEDLNSNLGRFWDALSILE